MQNVSNEEIKERFAVAPSLTVTELCDILVELTPARRRATLFALECNLKPAQVILLT